MTVRPDLPIKSDCLHRQAKHLIDLMMHANVLVQSGVKPRLMISTIPSQSGHRYNMSIAPVHVTARLIATATRKCWRQSVEQVHVGLHPARATGRECQKP